METLLILCLVVFMLALVINAYAYDTKNYYLITITDWIMLACLSTIIICLIIYAFNPYKL